MNTARMKNKAAIGIADFGKLIEKDVFYVDKTDFIKEWWDAKDEVTLITRPRRFGKTLNMSMVDYFFSNKYDNQEKIFKDFDVWKDEKLREEAGSYPVLFLSFANVKAGNYAETMEQITAQIKTIYRSCIFLKNSENLSEEDKIVFLNIIHKELSDVAIAETLHVLSELLAKHFHKKVIIILDEYDTPVQEAWVNGYWDKMSGFMRNFFNSTFKTNPYLNRALLTGITRAAKESIFSDFNNPRICSVLSDKYSSYFGFTEEEVFKAMDLHGLSNKDEVRYWYDGYMFGNTSDIYNPWSVINYLVEKKIDVYWANSSSNNLVSKLLKRGSVEIKTRCEQLLDGKAFFVPIDEQLIFEQLDYSENAIWSLLFSTGYLSTNHSLENNQILFDSDEESGHWLSITNREVQKMFVKMFTSWFAAGWSAYRGFLVALLDGGVEKMNMYLSELCEETISSFDTASGHGNLPERFYHGLVLGMISDMRTNYVIKSNHESGFGRYDVMVYRRDFTGDGIIIEFKVKNRNEKSLYETVQRAIEQIEEKDYAAELKNLGYTEDRIKKYGFAFEGKNVLIGDALEQTLDSK